MQFCSCFTHQAHRSCIHTARSISFHHHCKCGGICYGNGASTKDVSSYIPPSAAVSPCIFSPPHYGKAFKTISNCCSTIAITVFLLLFCKPSKSFPLAWSEKWCLWPLMAWKWCQCEQKQVPFHLDCDNRLGLYSFWNYYKSVESASLRAEVLSFFKACGHFWNSDTRW